MRPKLTYANVVATLALFIAIGGASAFAASHLGKNSVGGKQLKKNAVTSPKVKDNSLEARDFKSGQLPAGAPGLQGARGPSDGYATNATSAVDFTGGEQILDSLSLPAGKYILTGYATPNNNTVLQQSAHCRITLGGTQIGLNEIVNLGPNAELDRQVLTITGGGTLAASDVAALRCSANTPEGNWLESGLTAIQVASLNGG